MADNEQKQVQIHVPAEKQMGIYSNVVSITVAENEMILDFAQVMPNGNGGELVSRIILSPQVGKNFMSAFQNAILDFDIARQKRKDASHDVA